MARFLLLIYGDERRWEAMSDDDMTSIDAGHERFRAAAGAAILAEGQLEPSSAATTLRAGGTGPLITDGPFVESKEALGGFYVIDVADRAAAVALASLLTEVSHDHSGVQVHPLVDHG